MRRSIVSRLIVVIGTAAVIVLFSISSFAQESAPVKAARLLNESKVKFTKVADNVWTIPYSGKSLKNFDVILSTNHDMLFMFVVPVKLKEYKPSQELFAALLNQNTQMDRVKIGIDDDKDATVRIDLSIRLVDRRELTENLDQLAAAADKIFEILQPHLVKPN
jgi:hypothetical protein